MYLHDSDERRIEVVGLGLFCIQYLNGIRASGDREDGLKTTVGGEETNSGG